MGDQYEPLGAPSPAAADNQYEVPVFAANTPPTPASPAPYPPPPPPAEKAEKSDLKSQTGSKRRAKSVKSGKTDKSQSEKEKGDKDKKGRGRDKNKDKGGRTEDEENQSNMSKIQSDTKQPTEEQELSTAAAAKKAQEIDKKDHLNKLRIKFVKRVKCGVCAGTIVLLIACVCISIPCALFAFNVVGDIFPADDDKTSNATPAAILAAATTASI